jgi:putative membrane protein
MENTITATDRARVSAAIRRHEARTSAEIIVVVAHQSDDYLHVPIHIATAVALVVPFLWMLSGRVLGFPPPMGFSWIFAYQLAAFILVAGVLSLPALRFLVTPKRLMRKYAHRNAAAQFLARNLHTTHHRTGVLIFVSLLERYCEIIADTAVAAKVSDSTWQTIIDEMLPIIRAGDLDGALVHGIERTGTLLARDFPPGELNPNELPDHLIVI